MVRLAHFSDIHLTVVRPGWGLRDCFTKRLTGWFNMRFLGRGARFRHAPNVMAALRTEFVTRSFDQLVFTGDASMLGFANEIDEAAQRLGVGDTDQPPGIAVPGNHDLYVARAVHGRYFETAFAPWQCGDRISNNDYPFAQKVGHIWLIGLNSACPNWLAWDASGQIGEPQLVRLRELCASLDEGLRVVVTHYPLLTESRKLEPRWHRLRDWSAALTTAQECKVGLWLHGHRHRWYVLHPADNLPFPTICAGSATQSGRWSYHDYTIDDTQVTGLRRVFDQTKNIFVDGEKFVVPLPVSGRS